MYSLLETLQRCATVTDIVTFSDRHVQNVELAKSAKQSYYRSYKAGKLQHKLNSNYF